MTQDRYLDITLALFKGGKISAATYDDMVANMDAFCDVDDDFLPDGYAEMEYDDFDSPEAIDGQGLTI